MKITSLKKTAVVMLGLACLTLANLGRAQTTIYTDNFNIPDTTDFNGSSQVGRHAGLLAASVIGQAGGINHTITNSRLNLLRAGGNDGRMRFTPVGSTGTRWNWASGAAGAQILADGGMKISFDWTATDNTSTDWISYSVGFITTDQTFRVLNTTTDFGILFQNTGGFQVFKNSGTPSTIGAAGSFSVASLTRHIDLNYAFTSWADGSTVVLTVYVDGVLLTTQTNTWSGNGGVQNMEISSYANGTKIDNFSVTSFAPPPIITVAANPTTDVAAPNYVGRPLNISAIIGGAAPILYQWKVDKGSGFISILNATNATLPLVNPQVSDSGSYRLSATNSAGGTNTASLALVITNAIFVATDTTLDSSTNYVGRTVNFSAAMGGSLPMTNQWKVDKGSGFVNVPNATNAALTLANVQVSDSGLYALFASNPAGGANSTPLQLTVTAAPANDLLVNLQFTGFTGGGTPATTQTNDAVIGTAGDIWNTVFTTAGSFTATVAGTCTNATPKFLNDSVNNGTAITLKFVGDYIYNAGPGAPFTGSPVAGLMSGLLGLQSNHTGTLTLSNLAAGTYDLYLYGYNQGAQTRSSTFNANGSSAVCGPNSSVVGLATPNNYIHLVPTVTANGVLTITFAGAATADGQMNGFQLKGPLLLPTLALVQDTVISPASTTVYAGNTVTFTASFGGTQPMTNQWKVDKGSGFVSLTSRTNTTLILTNVQVSDSGSYALFAANAAGNASSTPLALTVVAAPTNFTVNVQFTGSGFGSGNCPAQTDGALIGNLGDVWNHITNPTYSVSIPGQANATNLIMLDALNIGTVVRLDYAGDYDFNNLAFAEGGNPFQAAGSPVANLMSGYLGSVSTGGHADTNTLTLHNLLSGSYDLYLYSSGRNDGQTRVNVFTANGLTSVCGPNNSNTVLTAGINYVHLTPTVTSNGVLNISYYGTTDAGQSLMNGFQLNGPVTLPTLFLSSDTTSDSPATNYAGRNITFAAAFGGNPPPTLQWKVNHGSGFVNVSASATNSSLTLAGAQASASGTYALFATNVIGLTNSTPLALTVLAAPTNNFAANLNVQFVGTSRGSGFGAMQVGGAVIGNAGDYWNPVSNPNPIGGDTNVIFGSGQILADASGIGTTLTVDYTGSTDLNTGNNNPFAGSGSPAENLMKAFLGAENNATATVTLHGILPGTYDLYLYSSAGNAGQASVSQFIANGATGSAGPNSANNILTAGANYVHLVPTVAGNGLLNISLTGTANAFAQLNGLQLSGPGAVLPAVTIGLQTSGSQVTLTWPQGTLLEATNLPGPWTVNGAASPFTFTPGAGGAQKFFKVQVQ